MNEKPPKPPSDPGLHEYVDAEFTIEGLKLPSDEKILCDTLEKLRGLNKFSLRRGNMTAHYDPVLLSRKRLEEAIEGAGFHISKTHVTASSPLTDALTEENKSVKNT